MRFSLVFPDVALPKPVENLFPHHWRDEWLDVLPDTVRLEDERYHYVRNDPSTHCPTDTPRLPKTKSVLRIVYRETALATRLMVFLLKAFQVRIEANMVRRRLREMKAGFSLFQNFPSWRQKLKTSKRISGSIAITSLKIPFSTISILGAVLALSLPTALFSSSRWKDLRIGPCRNFGDVCGMISLVVISIARCTWLDRDCLSRGSFI